MAFIYQEDWEATLQERLTEPAIWREINKVEISNKKKLHNPYSTPTATRSGTRGSVITFDTPAQTDQNIDITDYDYVAEYVDFADLAQSNYAKVQPKAQEQGETANEKLDNSMLASHANWTDFGLSDIGGGGASTDTITVSVTNVPKIVNNIVKVILDAKGIKLMQKLGPFIVWRATDYADVAQAAQNLGFMEADKHIRDGAQHGMFWGGVYHYFSNQHTANHLFAGVRQLHHLGIVEGTFGKVYVIDHPSTGDGTLSGLGIETRIDRAFKTWFNVKPVLLDVNVV